MNVEVATTQIPAKVCRQILMSQQNCLLEYAAAGLNVAKQGFELSHLKVQPPRELNPALAEVMNRTQ